MVVKHSSKILNLFFILIVIFITILTTSILNQNEKENKYSLIEGTVGVPSNINPIMQNHSHFLFLILRLFHKKKLLQMQGKETQ